jgi:NAD(P)-dependent dehydrogenase (short-subunit alcohol dehydrogenase family)
MSIPPSRTRPGLDTTRAMGDASPRTWLITGSSRGLGRALAEAALAAGDNVVATARDPDQLRDLVKRYPTSSRAVRLDVTDPAQASAAVEATTDAFGRLDVVVNNAGYANVNSIEDFAEDDFRAQIETNLWGVINLTRAAVPVLREQSSGHILQISSVGGRDTTPGLGPYQTAKWAVEGFSGVLQKELAPLGIHVTLIEPGGVRTDWAGASMHVADVRSVYQPTVGLTAEYAASGTPRGDPFKTAQAILQITQVDDPPLRLLLGSEAFTIARAADEAKIASDERWKDLTLSTDADDVSREDKTRAHIPDGAPAVTPTPTGGPLIFLATNRLKPGRLDAERRRVPGLVEFVEQNEPQLIAFNEYVNEDGTEVTVVQVHPDAASVQKHLGIIGERAAEAYKETLDATLAIQIFGPVGPQMLDTMRAQTGEGVSLTVATEHLGGFTRTTAGRTRRR